MDTVGWGKGEIGEGAGFVFLRKYYFHTLPGPLKVTFHQANTPIFALPTEWRPCLWDGATDCSSGTATPTPAPSPDYHHRHPVNLHPGSEAAFTIIAMGVLGCCSTVASGMAQERHSSGQPDLAWGLEQAEILEIQTSQQRQTPQTSGAHTSS